MKSPVPSQERPRALRDTRSEKQVEASGDRGMELLGFWPVRFSQARATRQTAGIPDRRYYHPDLKLAVWWEAKKQGGRQSIAQETFMRIAQACGEHYILGTDDDLAASVVPLIQHARKLNV